MNFALAQVRLPRRCRWGPKIKSLALRGGLGYEHFSHEAKLGYNQTAHPNALPTSWHCPG